MSNAIAMSLVAQPTSTVVVQNDEITLTPLAVAQPLTKVLADLETQRVVWEEGVYRTSNLALYALLAHCLAIAQADTPELAKQRNAGLEAFYKLRAYKVTTTGISAVSTTGKHLHSSQPLRRHSRR